MSEEMPWEKFVRVHIHGGMPRDEFEKKHLASAEDMKAMFAERREKVSGIFFDTSEHLESAFEEIKSVLPNDKDELIRFVRGGI